MPNHSNIEAIQSYDIWYEDYKDDLDEVEHHWTHCVELITSLKKSLVRAMDDKDNFGDDDDVLGESFLANPTTKLLVRAPKAAIATKAHIIANIVESATLGIAFFQNQVVWSIH